MKELSLVAVVEMNNGEAWVLNRPLDFSYEARGNDFVGADGPFRRFLEYSPGYGRLKAFAGAALTITMKDGSTKCLKDHWWHAVPSGFINPGLSDVESLRKCYVFGGSGCIAADEFADLRATYKGCVYPYWEYEKIIKYDSERKYWIDQYFKEKRRADAILAEARSKSKKLKSLTRP